MFKGENMEKRNNLHIQTEELAVPEVTTEAEKQDGFIENQAEASGQGAAAREKTEAVKEDGVEISYTGAVPEVRFSNIKKPE